MTQPCGDSSCSSVDCRPYRLLFGLGPKKNTSPFQGIHLRNQQPLQHLQCVSICTSIEAIRSELHKNLPVTFAIQNGRDSGSAAAECQSHQNGHPSIHVIYIHVSMYMCIIFMNIYTYVHVYAYNTCMHIYL